MITVLQTAGLSHSEIHGSKDICSYPRLIAAYHVLHRLREPRHPPDALTFFRLILHPRQSKLCLRRSIAHTFSCNFEIINLLSLTLISLYLQSCVSICQRSRGKFLIPNSEFLSAKDVVIRNSQFVITKVENNGFEPLTPCLQSRCSSQLS